MVDTNNILSHCFPFNFFIYHALLLTDKQVPLMYNSRVQSVIFKIELCRDECYQEIYMMTLQCLRTHVLYFASNSNAGNNNTNNNFT